MQKIFYFFKKNLLLKIITVFAALIIWIFVQVKGAPVEVAREVTIRLLTPDNLTRVSDPLSPLKIRLRGPKYEIRGIKNEDLFYDIDATNNSPGEFTVKFIDSKIKGLPGGDNTKITSIEPTQVQVVLAKLINRRKPVSVNTKGKVAQGFEVVEEIVTPKLIEIAGAEEEVNRLVSVSTEQIDITGATTTIVKTVGLDLTGQHIELVNVKEVTVKIEIDESYTTVNFVNIPITVTGTDFKFNIIPKTLDINLQGPENMMKTLSNNDIKLIIDVTGKEPGEYKLRPKIELENYDLPLRHRIQPVIVYIKNSKRNKTAPDSN